VLARVPAEEAEELHEAVVLAADAVEVFVAAGLQEAMNRYNNRGPSTTDDPAAAD
jgi:hypothetical protein